MLLPATTRNLNDLQQILRLQQENLAINLNETERQSQGFVTLRHDLVTLEKMHKMAPSIIIKKDDEVIAYALTMLPACRNLIPDLEPMFALLDGLKWNDRPVKDCSFYVMGQVCIARLYRGKGLFEQLYNHHKKIYSPRFDLIITEISARNPRSIRAHEKIGFRLIHSHREQLDEWKIVGWNWKG